MKVVLATKLVFVLLISTQLVLPVDSDIHLRDQLVAVVVCFRHGDRAPSTSFPNDPYLDEKYWPNGLGELLNVGKKHQYKVGNWLRARYNGFLSNKYSPKELLVKSTYIRRTLESAEYNLRGLYGSKFNSPSNPIPIYTVPEEEDAVLAMRKKCEKYDRLYEATLYSEYFGNVLKKHEIIKRRIEKNTGWNITDVNFFKTLHLVFDVYEKYNVSYLPKWADEIDGEELAYLSGLAFTVDTFYPTSQRLKVGPFFNYLNDYLDGVIDGSNPKFLMLSGHDGTIASILNTYKSFDYRPPEFCSMIIWELYKTDTGSYYLKILFRKDAITEYLQPVKVGDNCFEKCSYSDHKFYLQNISVDFDIWNEECNPVILARKCMNP